MSSKLDFYRKDIDGLRGIAVLAVVLFHVFPSVVPGGFTGVDIFFVISGFVITSLLRRETQNSTFSFVDFYKRRMKRLMPALAIVSIVTYVFSTWMLEPVEYTYFTTSCAAAWTFASNLFFSMLSAGYFSIRSEQFPFLHTWSLAVEEQFYLLYPMLLIFLFKRHTKLLIPLLVGAAALFLVVSQLHVTNTGSYFLLSSRAHELLIGSLTCIASSYAKPTNTKFLYATQIAGIALMSAGLFILNRTSEFPGFNSLYPAIGTALLLFTGQRATKISSGLSNSILVKIGHWSYSLYLFHWPIIALLKYRDIEISPVVGITVITLSMMCGYLTFRFIENPIRQSQLSFKQAFALLYCLPATFFLIAGIASYVTHGIPQRFSPELRTLIASYSSETDLSRKCTLRSEDFSGQALAALSVNCRFGDNIDAPPSVLLFGDSHANHFKPFIDVFAKQAQLVAVYSAQGSCDPLYGLAAHEGGPCSERNHMLYESAKSYRFIVVAAEWKYLNNEQEFKRKLTMAIEKIEQANAIPVIFKDNPAPPTDMSHCILKKMRGWLPASQSCDYPVAYVQQQQGGMDKVIDQVSSEYANVIVIDPKLLMCDTTICRTYEGNIAYFRDSNHLNQSAGFLLANSFLKMKKNPLTR